MKKIKFLFVVNLIVLACFIFTSCGFGSYDLEFVLPDGSVFKTYTYGPNDAYLKTTYSAPSVIGYNFVGWSENENLENVISIPYSIKSDKLFAKYEINRSLFYSHNSIIWNGNYTSLNIPQANTGHYIILIERNNSSIDFHNIKIESTDFVARNIILRNSNAKQLKDSDSVTNEFTINSASLNGETSYILEIEVAVNSDFTIIVS